MKYIVTFCLALCIILLTQCKNDPVKQEIQTSSNEIDNSVLIEKGKSITASTFLALSGELQKAMKAGGPKNAIEYCSVNALKLTDSLSKIHNVDIKRTSDKYRNLENKPTEEEKKMFDTYKNQFSFGQVLLPKIVNSEKGKIFHAPIIVQDMCLKCHGQKENISEYALIEEKYPGDLATGYKQGDLRGMWSVTFKN